MKDSLKNKSVIFRSISVALAVSLFSACSHKPLDPQAAGVQNLKTLPTEANSESELPIATLRDVESFRLSDPEGPKVLAEEFEQIPTEINPLVEKWIAYFQGRGRGHMERYLSRSTRYMKIMKKILRDNGLPEDLIYIALIESGFSYKATSRAAAVGYWQFIRGTGRRYGMEINAMIDERRDPILSTQAAAEYFKGLYSVFGSWYLAMASYNVGENRVKREVMKNMTRDFWVLAKKRRLPKETINYVPKFIAAKLIGNNPAKYGFVDIDYMTPLEFEHITVDRPLNLKVMAEKMNYEYDDLKQLNPKFKGEIAPLKENGKLDLRVPLGMVQQAKVAAAESAVEKVEYIADAGEIEIYKVKTGDSLKTIARKYKTTVAWLRDQNDLKKGKRLRIGQRIFVPDLASKKSTEKLVARQQLANKENTAVIAATSMTGSTSEANQQPDRNSTAPTESGSVDTANVEKASPRPEIITGKGVFYIVQAGDTLTEIADDYNSSVEELRKMNKLSKGSVLRKGMRIKVPKDDGLPTDPNGSKGEDLLVDKNLRIDDNVSDKNGEKANDRSAAQTSDKSSPDSNVEIKETLKASPDINATEASADRSEIGKDTEASQRRPQSDSGAVGGSRPSDRMASALKSSHVVQEGENLVSIAHRYGVTVNALRKANNLRKKSVLRVGAKLVIPGENRPQTINKNTMTPHQKVAVAKKVKPRVHIVKKGENLHLIAEKYKVEIAEIRNKNKSLLGSKLFVGSRLLIPSSEAKEREASLR